MRAEIEDFKTGWFGLRLRFRPQEVESLIEKLRRLKTDEIGHFHFVQVHIDEESGIADVELSLLGHDETDNMEI